MDAGQAHGPGIAGLDDTAAEFWIVYERLAPVPTPTPPPAPVPAPAQRVPAPVQHSAPASVERWRGLVAKYVDWDAEVMLRIIACESGGQPDAVSPDGQNAGAYQENVIHGYSYAEMTDPVRSTEIAHDIWLSQGYEAWSCY